MFGKNTVYKKFLDYKQIPNKQYEIEIDDFSFREETFNEKDIMITIWVIGKYKSFIIIEGGKYIKVSQVCCIELKKTKIY